MVATSAPSGSIWFGRAACTAAPMPKRTDVVLGLVHPEDSVAARAAR